MSQKLALIIGNSEYDDAGLARLVTPGADAGDLAGILRDPQVGGFDEVTALVNQSAAAIRRSISAFFANRGRDDLLLLYFSGHGVRDDRGQLFLAAKDTEHGLLRGTAIPANFITDEMDNSRSRRQVLILDCCHSGAFSQGMKGVPGSSVGTAAAFEGTGSGRVVLTATDSTQYAWEGDQVIGQAENSVFTRFLVQGLKSGEADTDADGRITLDELYDYVYEKVVNETPRQTPSKWSYGQQGEIIIASNPHPVVKKANLPPELQQAAEDPRPWVREGVVQELDRILKGPNPGLAQTALDVLRTLADDDSRRVASLAAQSLAGYEAAQPAKSQPKSVPQAPEPVPSSPIQAPAEPKTDLGKVVQEQASRQPPVPAIAQTGQPPAEQGIVNPGVRAAADQTAGELGTTEDTILTLQVLIASAGWALAFAAGLYVSWTYRSSLIGLLPGAIGGGVTALMLRIFVPNLATKHLFMIVAGWSVAMALCWGPNSPVGYLVDYEGGRYSSPLVGGIIGLLGGLVMVWVLQRVNDHLEWKQLLWIIAAWAVAGGIGMAFFPADTSRLYSAVDMLPIGLLIGAVAGAIGSSITFWQLGQAAKEI